MEPTDSLDRFFTPAWCTKALLKDMPWISGWRILEPCAGDGGIAIPLREAGCEVITADKVKPRPSRQIELVPRPTIDPDLIGDLLDPEHQGRLRALGCHAIITNFPYNLAARCVRASLSIAPIVIALFRISILEACEDRAELITTMTRQTIIGRVKFRGPAMEGRKKGSDNVPHAWCMWGLGGPPTTHWVSKSEVT